MMERPSLEKKVIDTIDKSGDLERLKYHLDRITGCNEVLILFSRPEVRQPLIALVKKVKKIVKDYKIPVKVEKECVRRIQEKLKKASRSKRVEEVRCRLASNGWIYPLIHGGIIYGYLSIVGKGIINKEILNFIDDYLAVSLEKALKEVELIKVHSSLRPRAIALSTVHTVHRLISSTLNIDELLPRLARLCLQVTRAKVCIIYLRKGKFLKPEAVASVNSTPRVRKISIIDNSTGRALEAGSVILTSKDLMVPLVEEELIGAICLRRKLSGKPFDLNDREILTVLAEQAVIAIKNAQLYETQERVLMDSLKTLSKVLDVKSPKTYTHPLSFLDLVLAIAEEYGVSVEEKEQIKYATLLLDTGKIAIPEEIWKKTKGLTESEYHSIKEHPLKSAEIVKSIRALKPAVPIILYHHERYDGGGYPKGLKGEKIPLGARILAVADAFEAMICHRPYKESLNFDQAISEIKKNSGKQFDPKVVEAFLRAVEKGGIKKIASRMLKEI